MSDFLKFFWPTLGILLGIAVPCAVVGILASLSAFLKVIVFKIEELKKVPPFDKVEFYKVPNQRMLGIKLFKNGVEVWDGGIDKDTSMY